MKIENVKKINSLLVFALAATFVVFVVIRILFPIFRYDSYSYNLHKINVEWGQIGEKSVVFVTPLFDYNYKSLKLMIEAENAFSQEEKSAEIYKGHVVQFYEEGEVIDSEQQFQDLLKKNNEGELNNGDLVAYNDAVFLISEGKRRVFLSPEIFERLGYDWDDVRNVDGDIVSFYEKGEEISSAASHPDSTILNIEGEMFLVEQKMKRKIDFDLSQEAKEQIGEIKIEKKDPVLVGQCPLQKKSDQKLICNFDFENNVLAQGQTYFFVMDKDVVEGIGESSISFVTFRKNNWEVAEKTLSRMKTTVGGRYFPELIN